MGRKTDMKTSGTEQKTLMQTHTATAIWFLTFSWYTEIVNHEFAKMFINILTHDYKNRINITLNYIH
jgi:hypothetical protein